MSVNTWTLFHGNESQIITVKLLDQYQLTTNCNDWWSSIVKYKSAQNLPNIMQNFFGYVGSVCKFETEQIYPTSQDFWLMMNEVFMLHDFIVKIWVLGVLSFIVIFTLLTRGASARNKCRRSTQIQEMKFLRWQPWSWHQVWFNKWDHQLNNFDTTNMCIWLIVSE